MALTEAQISFLENVVVEVIERSDRPMTASNVWYDFETRIMPGFRAWENTEAGQQGISISEAYDWRRPENLWKLVSDGRVLQVTTTRPRRTPQVLYFPKGTMIRVD